MFVNKMTAETSDVVIRYHEETKHHYHRYARSPGYMDWKNQPNPFRLYEGCERIPLPLGRQDPDVTYSHLYQRGNLPVEPVNMGTVGGFLALSLGLSAWKAAGDSKWALRMNPSSGNLHPTEAHLLLPETPHTKAGIFHYSPLLHALERRATVSGTAWEKIHDVFGTTGFFIALTSIFWRESWKYGERAFRYCQLDAGHALAALSLAANLFGWRLTSLDRASDNEIETLFGLDKTRSDPADREHPDFLCYIVPHNAAPIAPFLPEDIMTGFSRLDFSGTPNRLSTIPVQWDIIDQVAHHTRKPMTAPLSASLPDTPPAIFSEGTVMAAAVIRKRRSAVSFDGKGVFPKESFFSLLSRTLPRRNGPPFDAAFGAPSIHLLIFVHRVEGFAPGLYFFLRSPEHLLRLKTAMKPAFLWHPVQEGLPLFLLSKMDMVVNAIEVSCHQEIAGLSCFSVGMIADFKHTVEMAPYRYRHLFWEAGMVGQVMYLEAEAHGFRGTGIGCFFDDAVHKMIGLMDNAFQSLYHFTVGIPVEDERLTTLPAYHHLNKERISPL
jgi:SagB-type dehydrogenase family enzyme